VFFFFSSLLLSFNERLLTVRFFYFLVGWFLGSLCGKFRFFFNFFIKETVTNVSIFFCRFSSGVEFGVRFLW